MKHSGLKDQKIFRLARREKARYEGGKVHEKLVVEGKTANLKHTFYHTPYRDIFHYLEKFNSYTTLAAQTLHEKGKKFNPLQLLRPGFDFTKIYIIRLGILDGFQGFIWAFLSSLYPVVKYLKLWDLNRKKRN
ncbi:hypothetical protein Dip510_001105 [Elusimicrobium posterum]|uniref:hypothetical protein n=1 Tax=Elusimicrobium posterum TaxID=3116653 RepID=UPI003C70AC91